MNNLDAIMAHMPETWRYRWCDAGPCGCMGCANASGQLQRLGYSRDDWEDWVARNPGRLGVDPTTGKSVVLR